MSLDVYLTTPEHKQAVREPVDRIFVRRNGRTVEISREEWEQLHPGLEPVVCTVSGSQRIYSANITHNLGRMAEEAGLYRYLWRPDENGLTKAWQLTGPLMQGLADLKARPEHYKQFNPSNGWGNYEALVEFVTDYLEACQLSPDADVEVSR